MPTVKLRLTTEVDATASRSAFKSLEQAAEQARARIKAILSGIDGDVARIGRATDRAGGGRGAGAGAGGGRGLGGGAPMQGPVQMQQKTWAQLEREADAHAKRMARIEEREARRKQAAAEREARQYQATIERAAQRREAIRDRENRDIEIQARRDQNRADAEQRALDRAVGRANRADAKERQGAWRSFGGSVAQSATGLVNRGLGVAGDIARGAGVSFDIAGAVRKRVELESSAIDLSNSAYQEQGKGIQTKRVNHRDLMEQAQAIGANLALSPESAMGGLQKFTAITGDLATARASLEGMGRIAKATGANLDDVVATAGEISKTMGEAATSEEEARDRAKQLYEIMKGMAGGGKLGSVELSDTAKHGGRIAAASSQFSGGASENVLKMAAFLQEARGGGGAWNAATAAGAVSGLVNTFKTPARQKAFDAEKIQIFDKDKKIRDPFAIMTEAIDKTAGDPKKLQGMFANVVGARAMQGLANIYLDASKGKTDKASRAAGRDALKAEFDRMTKKATMSDQEVTDSSNKAMGSMKSKAELFQQNMDKIVGNMAEEVMPALSKLAPEVLRATSAMGDIVVWATKNPAFAAVGAAGGVVAKAGAERVAGNLVDKATGAVAGAGALGAALVTTMVIASVGALTIEKIFNDKDKNNRERVEDEAKTVNTMLDLKYAKQQVDREGGKPSSETTAALEKAQEAANAERASLQSRIEKGRKAAGAGFFGTIADNQVAAFNSTMAFMNSSFRVGDGGTMEDLNKAQEDAKHLQQLSADLKALQQIMSGNLKVDIQNLPAAGAPVLSGAGRTGPGQGG